MECKAGSLGIRLEGASGPAACITDVPGVEVGVATVPGEGTSQAGVTVILPRGRGGAAGDPVFAGTACLNGNGELTASHFLADFGTLHGPIGLTSTHGVGLVRDHLAQWMRARGGPDVLEWYIPCVAETWDGWLNDIDGEYVQKSHVDEALANASSAPVPNGNVGGGAGMMLYEFKGGTGTASRLVPDSPYTVGVLVQANYGRREQLVVAGVPVGQLIGGDKVPLVWKRDQGSIIVTIATDAPLLPHQLNVVARHAAHGIARVGGVSGIYSGDIAIAFSTANCGVYAKAKASETGSSSCEFANDKLLNKIFSATAYATEEAILNALLAAKDVVGQKDRHVYQLPHKLLAECFESYRPPKLHV